MEHPAEALKGGKKQLALRIINLIRSLSSRWEGRIIGNQLLRSGNVGSRKPSRLLVGHVRARSFWRSG